MARRLQVVDALDLSAAELPGAGETVRGPWLRLGDSRLVGVEVEYDKGAESGVDLFVEVADGSGADAVGHVVVDHDGVEMTLGELVASVARSIQATARGGGAGSGGIMPRYQAQGTVVSSNTTTLSPAWPTHAIGDVAILLVENRNSAITLSTASGFVEVSNSPIGTGTAGTAASVGLAAFWCRATTASMAAPVVAFPGAHHLAQIITFRYCAEDGDPIEAVVSSALASASASVTVPAVTTERGKCLVLQVVADRIDSSSAQADSWASPALSSFAEIADSHSAIGNGGGFAVAAGGLERAGSSGAATATLLASSVQARMAIALRPRRAPLFIAEGTRSAAGGPHNGEEGTGPAWPTHEAGDIGLMIIEHDALYPITLEEAHGFELIAQADVRAGEDYLTSTGLSIFWCRATSASMPQPVIQFPDPDPGEGEDHWVAEIVTFRGCVATGRPYEAVAADTYGDDESAAITAGTIPGSRTLGPDRLVLCAITNTYDIAAHTTSGWTNADLVGIAEIANAVTSFGKGGGWSLAAGRKVAAGEYGQTTMTWQFAGETMAKATLSLVGSRSGAPRVPRIAAPFARICARSRGGSPSTASALVARAVLES